MTEISSSSFIDLDFYNSMVDSPVTEDTIIEQINIGINYAIGLMEGVCGRKLKSCQFSYDSDSDFYDPNYTIFDSPFKSNLWLPAYPVTVISSFNVSGLEVDPYTELIPDGYILYPKIGKIYYPYGFPQDEYQNVKVNYTAGYVSTDLEYNVLQIIQFQIVQLMVDNSFVSNDSITSESIGNYKYTKSNPSQTLEKLGLPNSVYSSLLKFRRTVFA